MKEKSAVYISVLFPKITKADSKLIVPIGRTNSYAFTTNPQRREFYLIIIIKK